MSNCDRVGDEAVGHGLASMKVGEEADPQSSEAIGPTRDFERRTRDLDVMALVHEAVARTARERADACCGAALQDVAAPKACRPSSVGHG